MSILTAQNHTPGFAHPVRDSQKVFRAVLKALAGPTTPQPVDVDVQPPVPLGATAGAIILALCDEQTPLWLDPALRADGNVAAWIAFHTGARIVDHARDALFVVALPSNAPRLAELEQGTDEEPHRSATLILDAQEAPNAQGSSILTASGPGVRDTAAWDGAGLPGGFLLQWQENRALFPRGVDVIITAAGTVRGLPRTTALTIADGPDETRNAEEKRSS